MSINEKSVSLQSRLNVRLSPEVKNRVARAASILGQDLTEFAVATLNRRAVEVIDEHDELLLGSEDYRFFLDTLDDTKVNAPSKRSESSAEQYRRGVRKGVRHHLAD